MNPHSSNAGPERTEVAVLANPMAGQRGRREHVEALAVDLRQRHLEPSICWNPAELSELLSVRAGHWRCVVAAGGDGTLLEVLNRAADLPVALLPLGNENLMARHFGIERSGPKLAAMIASAHTRKIDLIKVNGRRAALMVSAGFDAEVVHRVHHGRRGHISKLSYALAIFASLHHYRFPAISVTIEETGEQMVGDMVFVFNVGEYALGLPIAPHAMPDDGLLDLYVFQSRGLLGLIQAVGGILVGRHEQRRDVQYRQVRRIRLVADESVPLQTDGDEAGHLPVDIEVVPAALSLVVPEAGP